MKINPVQIGPCSLDEAVALLCVLEEARRKGHISPDTTEGAGAVLAGTAAALAEDRSLKQKMKRSVIMATFEGMQNLPTLANPFEALDSVFRDVSPVTLQLPYHQDSVPPGESKGIEYLALYVPEVSYGNRRGIYLHASRILDTAAACGAPLATAVVPSICVHELFHAFMEQVLDPVSYAGHAHHPCLWEEAAANRAAVDWAQKTGVFDAALRSGLFPTRAEGGLPGYGSWDLVGPDYACRLSN